MRISPRQRYDCFLLAASAWVVLLVTAIGIWSCSEDRHSGDAASITIAVGPNQGNALLYVADAQKYFAANGLDVGIKKNASGLSAAADMLKGEAHLSTATEFVIVGKAINRQRILNIATLATFYNEYLIARTDCGIHEIGDLREKRIALPKHTSAEFDLGRFLELHGINIDQVTIVDLSPNNAVAALANKDVEGIVVWEPYASMANQRIGEAIVAWSSQSGQPNYWNLIGSETWVTQHPDLVKRVLQSLNQAEDYIVHHPGEAKTIVQRQTRFDDAYMARTWSKYRIRLSLDQTLIVSMKDQARWMIRNNYTTQNVMPEFRAYIYTAGLESVKPGAVSIIR